MNLPPYVPHELVENNCDCMALATVTLARLCRKGQGDSEHADQIRAAMDVVAKDLTPEQLDVFRKLAEILNDGKEWASSQEPAIRAEMKKVGWQSLNKGGA